MEVVRKIQEVNLSDEEKASQYYESSPPPPNVASRHEKPVDGTPSSTIQNLDIRSHFYEDDPEANPDDDDDTVMT